MGMVITDFAGPCELQVILGEGPRALIQADLALKQPNSGIGLSSLRFGRAFTYVLNNISQ